MSRDQQRHLDIVWKTIFVSLPDLHAEVQKTMTELSDNVHNEKT